jgi:hypothetical protein
MLEELELPATRLSLPRTVFDIAYEVAVNTASSREYSMECGPSW